MFKIIVTTNLWLLHTSSYNATCSVNIPCHPLPHTPAKATTIVSGPTEWQALKKNIWLLRIQTQRMKQPRQAEDQAGLWDNISGQSSLTLRGCNPNLT